MLKAKNGTTRAIVAMRISLIFLDFALDHLLEHGEEVCLVEDVGSLGLDASYHIPKEVHFLG